MLEVVVLVGAAGRDATPQTTKGFMLIAMPGLSGAVTIPTVCQVLALSGIDERSPTLRSFTTPGAETCALPLMRIFPKGQAVMATRTVPTGGFGADVSVGPATTDADAMVPAGPDGPGGPVAPLGPGTPWGPCAPVAPVGPTAPRGPDVLAGIFATA